MNKEQYFDKVDWEGGLVEALIGYGLEPNIDDAPDEINEALVRIAAIEDDVRLVNDYLYG